MKKRVVFIHASKQERTRREKKWCRTKGYVKAMSWVSPLLNVLEEDERAKGEGAMEVREGKWGGARVKESFFFSFLFF